MARQGARNIINSFFNQADAISTVKLLQLANQRYATNSAKYKDIVVVTPKTQFPDNESYFTNLFGQRWI